VVLQHGSILIGSEHKKIVEYVNLPSEEQRAAIVQELDERTTELSTVLHRTVSYHETADAILQGFRKAWSISPEIVHVINEKDKVTI
jgi:lipoate-protein ligase A